MEKLIVDLLEVNRQLENDDPVEFDFDRLKKILGRFQQKSAEFVRFIREEKILRDYLSLQVTAKLRALAVLHDGADATCQTAPEELSKMTAEKLIGFHNRLQGKLNKLLSSRPRFRAVVSARQKVKNLEKYKLDGPRPR